MKKNLLFAAMFLGLVGNAMADDVTTATYGNATGNTERTLTVALNHSADYCAFQLDLTLPSGTTVDETKLTAKAPLINGGKITISGTEESTDFVLAGNKQTDGKYRIVGYNLGNANIGTGEVLLTIPLKTTEGVAFNAGAVTASNVAFVKKTVSGETTTLSEVTLNANADQRLWGDVNKDKKVNASDVDAAISATASGNSEGLDHFATNTGIEGTFKATDINNVINYAK